MTSATPTMLPASVRPLRYDLTLSPNLEEFTFRGEEAIEIEVAEATFEITLNASELELHSCQLALPGGSRLSPVTTELDPQAETATLRFAAAVPAGSARLQITFSGRLNDRLRGFYRSRYTDAEGRERHLATTQFEATDARLAFPCWDEPSLKARFRVTLVVPPDMVALSNTPVEGETRDAEGRKRVRFAETPAMSTYLLAFIVGDLRSVEQRAASGTLVRVWATRGKEEQGRFALETSVKLLAYFNDYFGIPYPLPKLDHIAVPDFSAGAMENWGAITYRETALLVDPQQSSAGTRQNVAAIVSHEMAHMWFGDLVTMSWWTDLWLNESFASWMGDRAVDHIFPEWEMWTQFVSGDTNRALSLDGLRNSHPIEQEVKDPAEISQLFDAISYSKGASIIRMLEQFLGPDVFQRGLRGYLDRHAYANATTRDLWDALAEASGQPVAEMMATWTQQTGYPVLDVATRRRERALEVSFTQRRFVYEHILGAEQDDGTLWRVPAAVVTPGSKGAVSTLMSGRTATVQLRSRAAPEWVKVNPQQTGFYRVNYSPEDWAKLGPPVAARTLGPADRLGLQNDAYALSKAGLMPPSRFLELARSYSDETDAWVCGDLAANLASLDTLLGDEPYHASYQSYARGIFQPIGKRAGWDPRPGEGHLDALLRGTVLGHLGEFEDEDVLAEARARFKRYLQRPDGVHPDIRRVVFALTAKRGDGATYETLWDLYRRERLQEEKMRLLLALTQFQQRGFLQQTLERSLSGDVRGQDTISVVTGVGSNRHGREPAWEFLKANWPELHRRYGEGGFGLMRLVSFVSAFTTDDKRRDVEGFFEAHPTPAAERTVRQALERIRLNVAWLGKNRADLASWFAAQG